MQSIRSFPYLTPARLFVSAWAVLVFGGCNEYDPASPPTRVLTTVNVSLGSTAIEVGEMTTATAAGLDQRGAPIATGEVTWASDENGIAGVNPRSGFIFAIAPGTTRITASVDGKIGERTITVSRAAAIRINEIQPRGDAPNGWLEFFNPTSAPVDLSFWAIVGSNFFGASYTFPSGTVIPARGFLVVEESSLPFSIGDAENIHLFSRFGVGVDHALWFAQPPTTLGDCPDGDGVPIVTTAPTKGTANACPAADESLGAGSNETQAR